MRKSAPNLKPITEKDIYFAQLEAAVRSLKELKVEFREIVMALEEKELLEKVPAVIRL